MFQEFKNLFVMRNILIILSVIFGLLGIVFVILPMGTIAFLPAGIALALSIIAYLCSGKSKRKFSLHINDSFILLLLSAGAKKVFVEDTVKVEKQFLEEKQQAKQDAQKDWKTGKFGISFSQTFKYTISFTLQNETPGFVAPSSPA
jgi:hypothetical protein